MKEYKYKGFENPIIDYGNKITYRGREVERYYHGYGGGMASGFSYTQLVKIHYINEMERIDEQIRQEEYRKSHPEEFKNIHTADENIDYFLNMVNT